MLMAVAAATNTSAAGKPLRTRAASTIPAATARVITGACHAGVSNQALIEPHANPRTFSPSTSTPSAAGSCWRPMINAIPAVKPSTTGSGMYFIARPAPVNASKSSMSPASTPTTSTPSAPWLATMGINTTVIAPVGPLTWTLLPPKTAARIPATMAVVIPAAAPTPDATPKPSARGRATRATMRPAERSRPIVARDQSERRGAKRRARDRMPTVEAAEEGRVMLLSCSFRAQ